MVCDIFKTLYCDVFKNAFTLGYSDSEDELHAIMINKVPRVNSKSAKIIYLSHL